MSLSNHTSVLTHAISYASVAHVKVDNVFGIGALHRDGEGLEGMEGERDESPDRVVNGSAQQACLDLKFQQSRVPRVEPAGGKKKQCQFIMMARRQQDSGVFYSISELSFGTSENYGNICQGNF